jgi:RNA polymerase sigma factor (sigma-70 family)
LLHFLTKRLRCPDTAAEITHETYIRFCQTSQAEPIHNARAMAYRIALNLAVDFQRKVKVRKDRVVDVDFESIRENYESAVAGPEQVVIAQQNLSQLEHVLLELPANCRTAFLWHSLDNLTYTEIANRMGVSESMVNKHLARAIAHCTQRLNIDDSN